MLARGSLHPKRRLGLAALLTLGVPAMFTRSFLYHPTRTPEGVLQRPGWSVERLPVAPDVRLTTVIRPGAEGAPWLLFFGGNAMGLDSSQAILSMIAGPEPWGLCAAAYRGYDGSDGAPAQEAIVADARAVLARLSERFGVPPRRWILIGQSLGTGVAADLAAHASRQGSGQRGPAGLVLISPYLSMAQVFDDHVPILPIGWLVSDPYRTEDLVEDLRGPILIVHGTEDDVIGIEHGRGLAALLGDRARLVVLEGRGHNDLWEDRRTVLEIRRLVTTAVVSTASPAMPGASGPAPDSGIGPN